MADLKQACSLVPPQHADGGVLAIILRGDTFRKNHGTHGAAKDPGPQFLAIQSIRQAVLEAAEAVGWSWHLFVDVVVPSPQHNATLFSGLQQLRMPVHAIRTRLNRTQATQVASWADTFAWFIQHEPALYSAVLVMRPDLVFRSRLCIPPRHSLGGDIRMAFGHKYTVGVSQKFPPTTPAGTLRVCDVLMLVPSPRVVETMHVLQQHAERVDMHDLCEWMPNVSFFVPTKHDSNTRFSWNPLYSIAGRANQKSRADHAATEATYAAIIRMSMHDVPDRCTYPPRAVRSKKLPRARRRSYANQQAVCLKRTSYRPGAKSTCTNWQHGLTSGRRMGQSQPPLAALAVIARLDLASIASIAPTSSVLVRHPVALQESGYESEAALRRMPSVDVVNVTEGLPRHTAAFALFHAWLSHAVGHPLLSRASFYGRMDDDIVLSLPWVERLLSGIAARFGTAANLYMGKFEYYHWDREAHRPHGWGASVSDQSSQ